MLLTILNVAGIAVFAASGALLGVRRRLDLFGIWVVAVLTGVGGGVMRDVFLGVNPPTALQDWRLIGMASLSAIAIFFFHPQFSALRRSVLILDALGMGLFASTGALTAVHHHTSGFAAVLIGITTAVGGGVLRDVLVNEVPLLVQQRDLYAVPAMTGATVVVLLQHGGAADGLTLIVGTLLASGLRLVAVRQRWRLPMAADRD
ncbi:trimeric intracellular cation channel family protein [Rudaeicoccus suwonensis]|uniref:Putative membrane protein YeiH n=1 Tax=Rudaeicoccus suwonensis TaxID=657409 RepID=A0A561E1A7_9MICO|nr:trimeric intracellular cation channel family protein [Rudaeicoccus suwonensis]TWE09370.1 putative membrane protein YeiH [Rudaeicoccus suwonensis]